MTEKVKVKCESHGGALAGGTWFAGWMFTIGFLELTFWKAVLGLILWPYYLGAALRAVQ
jgi:hypothetical protein